jgi:isopenicillin-N epimerase
MSAIATNGYAPQRVEDFCGQPQSGRVTISHGFGKGFRAEFDWTGTADRTAFLSIGTALDFHYRLRGPALMARNAALVTEASALLCERLDAEPGCEGATTAAMNMIRIPLAGPATPERASQLRERLLSERSDAPIHAIDGGIWMRTSAHAYNEIDDCERLAEIVRALC